MHYDSTAALELAHRGHVGTFYSIDLAHHPVTNLALAQASLQTGESVLDIGAGSGRLIAQAKQFVGRGLCVAVDAVSGFINTDIPWLLGRVGLTVYPHGTAQEQVHLVHADATSPSFQDTILAMNVLPLGFRGFDCIFAIRVLDYIPPQKRQRLLHTMRDLLHPDGRLITTMTPRFTNISPYASEAGLPIQFRTSYHTECPGSILLTRVVGNNLLEIAQGQPQRPKKVHFVWQIAPDRFWVFASEQARAAAEAAGLHVMGSRPIGTGLCFHLPDAGHSPSLAALNGMSSDEGDAFVNSVGVQKPGRRCIGRLRDIMYQRRISDCSTPPCPTDDYLVVKQLQEELASPLPGLASSHPLPAEVRSYSRESAHVACLVVLSQAQERQAL
ncbi:S-adenosyl-L-methionine-dependent methyltransferase [Phaeosphaeriaceae sp. PMI808]|nr:S-adenosyl-L-methionine-dependent methyltransferase [Phaeosphaeriaceae sp. PMI808]